MDYPTTSHLGEIHFASAASELSSITDADRSNYSSTSNEDASVQRLLGPSPRAAEAIGSATQNIYGRSKETLQLLKTYQKLLQTKRTQTVFVHGESGSGKTALVEMIRDQVCISHGYFVTGKYIQNTATREPYSAIMAAFSDICDLTAQSEEFDELRRSQIEEGLGPDAIPLLIKVITSLSPFIGEPNAEFIDLEPSFSKFKTACKSFLRVMAAEAHPIVLFIDDIQWADKASRLLIGALLQDTELKNVMFILAYRDEEAAKIVDMLLEQSSTSNSEHDPPVEIALTSLDECAIHQIVTSILSSNTDELRDLSKLVARRASGNPFHARVLLESIIEERLLIFDVDAQMWIFELGKLQEDIMVSDNLADLLTRKIARLAPLIKETLKVASLVGYQFGKSMLLDVVTAATMEGRLHNTPYSIRETPESIRHRVLSSLSEAIKGGFIETLSDGYHFTHDKLQASFKCLIDEREKGRLHLLIGEAYLANTNTTNEGSANYNAAVHLNCAPDFISEQQRLQQAKLAKINLDAAKHCELKSAFVTAAMMLRKGLDSLDPDERWSSENFDLTFEMMERLARTELVVGDFEACKETTREALCHGKTVEMKINLLMIDVEVRAATLEAEDGFVAAFRALAVLGVKMPRKSSLGHVLMKLLKVRLLLRHKSDDYLLRLPTTDDRLITAAVKLLMYVCTYGLTTDNKETAIVAALLAMELTLKRGVSLHSPFAFAIYGVAEIALGNIERAYRFGKISLATLDRVSGQEAACPTVGFASTLLLCRKESIKKLIDPLYRVGKIGYSTGEIIFGSYCLSQSYAMQSILGTKLEALEKAMRNTYTMVSDMGQETLLLWHQPYLQHTINMRSSTYSWENNLNSGRGEIMNEKNFFLKVEEANNPVLKLIALRVKAQEAVFFAQYNAAVFIYDEIESIGGAGLDRSHRVPSSHWFAAQAYSALYSRTGKRSLRRKARKYMKLLERMDADGCPNVSPYLVFLRADEASQRKSTDEAALRSSYNRALDQLRESDYVHLEGLLCERAGFEFVKRGQRSDAECYFRKALNAYLHDWGSIAKYNWLREQSKEAIGSICNDIEDTMPALYGKYITVIPN